MSKISLNSKQNIRVLLFDFACIFITVALNDSASLFSSKFHLPLYMDSIATIALASLCGFFPAVLGAFLTNLVITLLGKLKLIFCLCQILTACGACLVFYFRSKNETEEFSLDSFMFAGILSAFSNGILGSLFAAFMGYNLSPIEKGLYFLTDNIFAANLAGGFILNLIDKSFAAFISYFIYLFARRFVFRAVPSLCSGRYVRGSGFRLHSKTARRLSVPKPPAQRHIILNLFQNLLLKLKCRFRTLRAPASATAAVASKKRSHIFFLKPEYIFVIAAGFTLITGIFLKNKITNTFSKEYNELVNPESLQNLTGGG